VTPFATIADAEARYPDELVTLGADRATGLRADDRIEATLVDASAEIRAILRARYTGEDFARLDQDSLGLLRAYAIDIALYRVALSFARSNDRVKERAELAVKRLEAIAAGRGALSFVGESGAGEPAAGGAVSPNEAIVVAPERMFTRQRMRGL